MRSAVEQFRDAILSAGLMPPDAIIADGKLRRFSGNGAPADDSAWLVLYNDGIPAGAFGDWRSGTSKTWRADVGRTLTPAEQYAHRMRVETMRRQRDAEEKRLRADAARKAAAIWNAATLVPDDHPYLTRKGIKAHGARFHNGALVIPLRDGGELHSLQFIGPDGEKRFLTGGRVAGCYCAIGDPKGAVALCIAEGFATGATIHEATGYPVAVAFNAGQLEAVAKAMRGKFPELPLILCADDDTGTAGNPGMTKATEAAKSVGGRVVIPAFGTDRPEGATDFNDMAAHRGAEAVKRTIAGASESPREVHQPDAGSAEGSNAVGRIAYRRALDIQAKPIRWLWQGRIARGKVSVLAGNPGLGKSQVTVSIAAVVTTGGAWPVDRTPADPGNVIFLSAEDDPADTIRPRLEAAGADLSRVFILDAVVESYRADGGEVVRAFNLKADLGRLGVLLAEIGNVALIVIDPITAYLGDADSHVNAQVRALLAPLSDLAAKHGSAVIAVTHLNKSGGSDALMRVTGSMAFVAAARAAWLVVKDPSNEDRRLFLPLKNNIGNDQTGLAFEVQSAQFKSAAGLIETSRVLWETAAVTVTANEAMALGGNSDGRSATDEAQSWLTELLFDGPMRASDAQKEARQAGIADKPLRTARERLHIKPYRQGFSGGWWWRLPTSQDAQIPQDAHVAHTEKQGILDGQGHLGRASAEAPPVVEVEI